MMGASATAGFTESEPLGGPKTDQYRLSRYLDAALLTPHEPVQNLANSMFFIQPEAAGRYQIDQALQTRPTLVVGVDFLFWFCYGEGLTEKDRLQRFEKGLKLIEAVQCPLVVGDIPDASGASIDMLPPDQIPSAETMSAANRRLKEWAATRKNVTPVRSALPFWLSPFWTHTSQRGRFIPPPKSAGIPRKFSGWVSMPLKNLRTIR